MGHTAYICNHRKGVHHNDINQDEDNSVIRVNNKVFLRSKPTWWLPPDVTDLPAMKAIQQAMTIRHKEAHARVNGLTNKEETMYHKDPSTPVLIHIDEEPPVEAQTIHPDPQEWHKTNTRPNRPSQKKKPKKQPGETPPDTNTSQKPMEQGFTINKPICPQKPQKGNPIPVPGEDHGMSADFPASQFPTYKKVNPPTQPIPSVVNCTINAILTWPLNPDSCKDLAGFAFDLGNSLPSANGSGSISTHSRLLYLSVIDPGMTSSQHDPLSHSVFLMSDHHPLPTI
ncbi:hypothetical protein DSO57_1010292 [Entomophthora muscae]|uniref:Uncharacterized protein n=1 Tax=Entomophthora muscae TaxID=34485 RepID=A0ACC2T6G8_9FUNG|nr:hypothetical protein DSO57_1010292 [Entomophthora muscae]